MSQSDLAQKVGATQAMVSGWENNQWMPQPRFRQALENVLGIEINWDVNAPFNNDEVNALCRLCQDTYKKKGVGAVKLIMNMSRGDIRTHLSKSGYYQDPLGLPADPRVTTNVSCGDDGPLGLPEYTPKR